MRVQGMGTAGVLLAMCAAVPSGQTPGEPPRDMPSIERQADEYIAQLEKRIAGKEQQPAEQVFDNIQTFNGMPAGRMLRVMRQAFVPNIGAGCDYCHDVGDWASDTKAPKAITRGMWTLRADVQQRVRAITKNDAAVVTCYTCHKGQPKPAFK